VGIPKVGVDNAVVLAKIGRLCRYAASFEVRRGSNDHDPRYAKFFGDQGAVVGVTDSYSSIEAFVD
jgi:hypothetical protein